MKELDSATAYDIDRIRVKRQHPITGMIPDTGINSVRYFPSGDGPMEFDIKGSVFVLNERTARALAELILRLVREGEVTSAKPTER